MIEGFLPASIRCDRDAPVQGAGAENQHSGALRGGIVPPPAAQRDTQSGAVARNPAPIPPALVSSLGAGNSGSVTPSDAPGFSSPSAASPHLAADPAAAALAEQAAAATFSQAKHPDLAAHALAVVRRRLKA